jgi:hypothetical protein
MEFTNDWFDPHVSTWNKIIPQYKPQKILEVGSYEGRSICHIIDLLGGEMPLEIFCVDTWQGGREHSSVDMSAVERRFDLNVTEAIGKSAFPVDVKKLKGDSCLALATLVAEGRSKYFDLVYIDGSHEAADVLSDAVLAFRLLREGGLMIFDDYLWGGGNASTALNTPKPAIDAFMNCYIGKIQQHPWLPVYQVYARKISS